MSAVERTIDRRRARGRGRKKFQLIDNIKLKERYNHTKRYAEDMEKIRPMKDQPTDRLTFDSNGVSITLNSVLQLACGTKKQNNS